MEKVKSFSGVDLAILGLARLRTLGINLLGMGCSPIHGVITATAGS